MGLFSLILLLVPFIIGGIALLLERVEAHLNTPEKEGKNATPTTPGAAAPSQSDTNMAADDTLSKPPELPLD